MFISKSILIKAIKELSLLDGGNVHQGLTVKVSVIRHFLALDALLKKIKKNKFDTTDIGQKKAFYEEVAFVVSVNQKQYTNNFINLKNDDGSCCTSSNFIGGGPVLKSKTSDEEFDYPSNSGSGKEVLRVKDGHVYFQSDSYRRLSKYLDSPNLKTGLFVWLARNLDMTGSAQGIYDEIREFLLLRYTPELVSIIAPERLDFDSFVGGDSSQVLSAEKAKFDEHDFASKPLQTTVVDCMKKTRQLITYGAPGTGKSHGVEEVVGSYENTVRTTFHPDSDYSTFVGCYKPTMEAKPKYGPQGLPIKVNGVELTEDIISYSYVPQAFTKAYVRAWKSLTPDSEGKVSPQFLVIEEINRGNCAQIFGDLFQLLDRDDGGYSKYAIEADSDLARHISKELANAEGDIPENIRKGTILRLPPNLYIWATMNTSDQSLFPMDSAFKRRWEWRYVPIRDAGKNWKIVSEKFDWWEFIKKVNGLISSATNSEDKQLGYFFARPDDASSNVISASRFVNKVLFYLYNDVFKDYDLPRAFSKQEGGRFAFGDFFLDNGEADEDAVNELLSGIFGEQAE